MVWRQDAVELLRGKFMRTEKKRLGRNGLRLAVAVAGMLGAQAAFAQSVSAGGTIRLDDSYGSGPGGEFRATVLNGGSGSFQTFCLEYNEYFSPGETLRVNGISSSAQNGGVNHGVGGTPTSDPLDSRTAFLYTKFRAGTLIGYDYGTSTSAEIAARTADANALQNAIWFLENEITSVSGQAATWVAQAQAAVDSGTWSGLGQVQVLNLYRGANFGTRAQDQLYITPVPEPETYMMLLAGLGLMGFVARRRQRSLSA